MLRYKKYKPTGIPNIKIPTIVDGFAEQPFARMMPCACGNIYFCIAVVYHMKFPHPFNFMHHVMRRILTKKIHEEQAQQYLDP